MAYLLVKTEDFNTYVLKHFIIDDFSDTQTILEDYSDCLHAGWTAKILHKNNVREYILDTNNIWIRTKKSYPKNIDNWYKIQDIVQQGKIEDYLEVGNQLVVEIDGTNYAFDVLGIDEDCPVDTPTDHVLSLQMHNLLPEGIPFDPAQLLYYVDAEKWANGLPAGTYNITLDSHSTAPGTYQFTTTQTIPIGGGIRHSKMGDYSDKSAVLGGKFTTYSNAEGNFAVIESNLSTNEGVGGTSLGTTSDDWYNGFSPNPYLNVARMQQYGSNRWKTSFARQWLNSDAETFAFVQSTPWSLPPATLPLSGFLYSINADLKAVLCEVRAQYELPVLYRDNINIPKEQLVDKVKLVTMTDVEGVANATSVYEGAVDASGNMLRASIGYAYSYWHDRPNATDRIKKYDDAGTLTAAWWRTASAASNQTPFAYSYNDSGTRTTQASSSARRFAPCIFIG